ncbi:PAS domain-containing protein [Ectothiorhodospiraceae bacterium 2226]|nr:PAS domain-containing protein [Ectothiorhodospiraceae bacterium 2226]
MAAGSPTDTVSDAVPGEPRSSAPSELGLRQWLTLLDNLTEGLVIADADGRLVSMNRAALDLLGFEDLADARRHISEFTQIFRLYALDGRELALEEWPLARALRGERFVDFELIVHRTDCREGWIANCGGAAVRGPDGQVQFAMHTLRNVTEQRRAQQAQREHAGQLRRLLDSLNVFVGLLSTDGVVLEANQTLLDAMGYRKEDVVGRLLYASPWWRHSPDLDRLREAVQTAAGGARQTVEACAVLPRGQRIIEFHVAPLFDAQGRVTNIVASGIDLTERKALETQLREQADALARADRRKNEFLAMLAHELRNPLTPVQNAAELLHLHADGLDDQLRWATEVIGRQGRHLVRLVDDLLDVARITQGRIRLKVERADLAELVNAALETVAPLIHEAQHRLEVEPPRERLMVDADPARISQVFANLLHNAAKYTAPGGHLHVKLEREGDCAVVSVRDDGQGIAPDILPHIFDLFAQEERALDRSQGGLGLGLTLVRRLVEKHGGSVSAQSSGPGCGSEFRVRLPLAEGTHAPVAKARPALVATVSGKRVLVVEDNADVAESLAVLLETMGHRVRVAADGEQALQVAEEFRPQVVLLDVGLPGMDGYEVARRLRAAHPDRRMVCAALTGYNASGAAREAAVDRHLLKPPRLEDLQQVLAAYDAGAPET